MHSTLHLCSSNQCDTARLESKLTSIQIMHISSHEIVHSFFVRRSTPVVPKPTATTRRCTSEKRRASLSVLWNTPSFSDLSLSLVSHSSHNCQFCTFLVSLTFLLTLYIFLTMMMIDHDAFLPAVVMTSYTPCCTNISRQYDGTHYYDNTTQHNTATSTTVLLTHHFLCPSIVRARLSLTLLYITINY